MNLLSRLLVVASFIFICISCSNSRKFNDQIISKSKDGNGITHKRFNRHDLMYVDKLNGNKILTREVFSNNTLMYRYPFLQRDLIKTELKLLSGNNFLTRSVIDTIFVSTKALPVMNRTVYVKGAMISRTSDSTYLIKTKDSVSLRATFVVTAYDNFEEISGRQGFIVDSLVIPIK